MNVARLLQIIASICALVAVSVGIGTYTHADFTNIHMLFGLLVAIALLILAVMAVFTSGLSRLGAIGIAYALIMPIFGVTQHMILVGNLHWLIEAAHLLVGFGAIAFIATISARFTRRKQHARANQPSHDLIGQEQPIRS